MAPVLHALGAPVPTRDVARKSVAECVVEVQKRSILKGEISSYRLLIPKLSRDKNGQAAFQRLMGYSSAS